MQFPAKKNAGCPKAPRDFPPRKDGILYPRRVILGLPFPSHRVCAEGLRDGHVTFTSQPKFLGSIGYQICLAMELRWRALPAGSAINKDVQTEDLQFVFCSLSLIFPSTLKTFINRKITCKLAYHAGILNVRRL